MDTAAFHNIHKIKIMEIGNTEYRKSTHDNPQRLITYRTCGVIPVTGQSSTKHLECKKC